MDNVESEANAIRALSVEEIESVSGGIVFAPVLLKIGAWALGAGFGAGMVVAVKHALR